MTQRAPVRQAHIMRAIKAARAAGVDVLRIEVATDGSIMLHTNSEVHVGGTATADKQPPVEELEI